MPALTLTKHHGWGNDFLVLLDLDDTFAAHAGALARALCDRHRGIGADGLIRISAGRDGADVAMDLHNADGGRAEMSGNGIRCVGQVVADAGLIAGKECRVLTAAGLRELVVHGEHEPGVRVVAVDMGPAEVGPDMPQPVEGRRARRVDIGNPHLVLAGADPSEVAVSELGPQIERVHDGGINVEFVKAGPGLDELTMRVWERGVGETLACGTGACAAAAAGHAWGLVGRSVTVHQPGGDAAVELGDDTVVLTGPSVRIGRVEVAWPPSGGDSWS